jgi:hypothetical protein
VGVDIHLYPAAGFPGKSERHQCRAVNASSCSVSEGRGSPSNLRCAHTAGPGILGLVLLPRRRYPIAVAGEGR